MLEHEITFDRVIRWVLVALGAVAAVLLVNRLSSVLLPFFIAWILAYMIYPFVLFLQNKCHLRYRVASIAVALLILLAVIALAVSLVVPPIIEESNRMAGLMSVYFHDTLASSDLFQQIQKELQNYANDDSMMKIMQHSSVVDAAESILVQAWELLSGTINFAIGLLGSLVVLLYLFFILMDYEKISEGWLRLIPEGNRKDDIPGMEKMFLADSIATVCGACLGTSTTTTFVESSAGVGEGAKTGLASVVTGFLFLIAIFFAPVFTAIPSFATAPALIFVGFLMVSAILKINFNDLTEAIPAYLCLLAMPLMYSIAEGIAIGVISYVIINLVCGKAKKITPLMYVLAVLFICKYIFL